MKLKYLFFILFCAVAHKQHKACSVLYYIDKKTGNIYAVNNEDYFYHVKPVVVIMPATKQTLARLWYGWDNFAQGGINESGLFFDGASTPEETTIAGYASPSGNLGDDILANCKTVLEALDFLEYKKVALTNGHLLFGDKTGHAMVVEWVNGNRNLIPMKDHSLIITNFLLSDPSHGNYPCMRYNAMEAEIKKLDEREDTLHLKDVGNVVAKAIQPKTKNDKGNVGGTLYSTFVNLTAMEFILIYKLENANILKLHLNDEFTKTTKRQIKLDKIFKP